MSDAVDKFVNFGCTGDPSNIGPRWERWLNSFEIFANSKGLIIEAGKDSHKQRRRALLLSSAGQAVQDIFRIRIRIYLLARRNLLWDILRLPSSSAAALGLYIYVILTL